MSTHTIPDTTVTATDQVPEWYAQPRVTDDQRVRDVQLRLEHAETRRLADSGIERVWISVGRLHQRQDGQP